MKIMLCICAALTALYYIWVTEVEPNNKPKIEEAKYLVYIQIVSQLFLLTETLQGK